ncbi:MAG: hypothetical protein JWQ84_3436, partial [Mucilaginibacter sp.]|nr:hypothetical protein [Mucilaginibacter sp.]
QESEMRIVNYFYHPLSFGVIGKSTNTSGYGGTGYQLPGAVDRINWFGIIFTSRKQTNNYQCNKGDGFHI